MIKRIIVRLLIVLTFASAGVAVAAVPAQAYPWPPTNCAAGRLCTYADSAGDGAMYYYTPGSVGVNVCRNIGPEWNDRITSAYNNQTGYRAALYQDANCGGGAIATFCATAGTCNRIAHLGNFPWFANDMASSLKFFT